MKFLKLKNILALSLILIISIFLLIFFIGGLKAQALQSNNLEFDLTGFVDYSPYDGTGNYTVEYNSAAEANAAVATLPTSSYVKVINEADGVYTVTFKLNKERIVAQNNKYTMFLNEDTTIISVAVNSECTPTVEQTEAGFINYKKSTCKTIFNTALDTGNSTDMKSNFILYYIGSNDKLSGTGFNTYSNSVLYNDLLYGTIKRHYQIKFDVENGVEILYEIGDFTVINSFFPEDFKRTDMEEYFRGNLLFLINASKVNQNVYEYSDLAYTWSKECAAYLEEKGLATVTPIYEGETFTDDEGNRVPSRYNLTNILARDEQDRVLNKLKMQAGVDYNATDFGEEGASPCTANPFSNSYMLANMFGSYYSLVNTDGATNNPVTYNTNYYLNVQNSSPTFNLKANSTIPLQKLFEYMYKTDQASDRNYFYINTQNIAITEANVDQYPGYEVGQTYIKKIPVLYDENPYDEVAGVEVPVGGYQAKDELGHYLYDEDNKPIQEVFKKEYADVQNDLYGNVVESNSPVFQIALRFVLSDQGLESTILNNSLREGKGSDYQEDGKFTKYSHDCYLGTIDVLPYFTSNNSLTSEGQIILPDGSGAIMQFNSPKDELGYTAYAKSIYGNDQAFTFRTATETMENKKMMFSMYGFLDKTSKKGVLAIADQGANQTSIYANFKRADVASTMNIANFKAIFREQETVYAGTAQTPFLKWSKEFINNDLKYLYQFLLPNEFIGNDGKIQYVSLANKYRDYLIAKYGLVPKDMTNDNVVNLNFLGAFEKREIALGFVYNDEKSLTTFKQAREIVDDLMQEGVSSLSVVYTAWTNDEMEPAATSSVKASGILGRDRGFRSFNEYLKDNNINLYPQVNITSNKGYDFLLGNLRYTAKSIGSTYASHRAYVLATGAPNTTIEPISMLSPKFYESLARKFFNSYDRFNIDGAFFSDIGNMRLGDYGTKNSIFAENGMSYQINTMEYLASEMDNVMLSAPFDYALKYATFAVDVPLESSLLGYYDYSIPFYQLVVSGLFDYAGPAVNNDSERSMKWYLLKALETGSNLNFMISYEDTRNLLDTNYTMYYNAYYANWKSNILYMNEILNQAKIHYNAILVGHKILQDNVYQVEYSNGAILVINYNNTIYYDALNGFSVRPNWFTIVQEGM
ncbi:MAG: DUF5696 domain-containing protein [Bacilli bacterium]